MASGRKEEKTGKRTREESWEMGGCEGGGEVAITEAEKLRATLQAGRELGQVT